MALKIVVLAKQVPDTRNVGKDAMTAEGTVNRAALPAIFNPEDLNALEQALRLKEQNPGSTVGILTMGPPRAGEIIRQGLYRGADTGWLLTDRLFAGADTLATSYALATAIKKIGEVDIVIGGRQAIDGDTAQVGAEVAEFLGIPHCYYVEKINKITAGSIEVTSEDLWGKKQVRRMSLPALVSVTKNITTPKLPTVLRRLESREIEIERLALSDLEDFIQAEETGSKGSPTKVNKVVVPEEARRTSVILRDDDEFIDALSCALNTKGLV